MSVYYVPFSKTKQNVFEFSKFFIPFPKLSDKLKFDRRQENVISLLVKLFRPTTTQAQSYKCCIVKPVLHVLLCLFFNESWISSWVYNDILILFAKGRHFSKFRDVPWLFDTYCWCPLLFRVAAFSLIVATQGNLFSNFVVQDSLHFSYCSWNYCMMPIFLILWLLICLKYYREDTNSLQILRLKPTFIANPSRCDTKIRKYKMQHNN